MAEVKLTLGVVGVRWPILLFSLIFIAVLISSGGFALWKWRTTAGPEVPPKVKLLVPPDPEIPLMPSPSTLHTYTKAAVCSDGPVCSKIGRDVMKKGGSAVDAAIAAMFCNGIVNMQAMGLGGGFFMNIYSRSERKAYVLNARESAPSGAHVKMFESQQGGPKVSSKTGGKAVGVPGELRGYYQAWKKFGKLRWAELVEPSISLCRTGYQMTQPQRESLEFRKKSALKDPFLREVFVNNATGVYYPAGSIIRPTRYCETLETIATEGGEALNNGSLTTAFAHDILENGGIVTEDDLRNYKAEWVDPVEIELRGGDKLFSVPPPGSGVLVAHILQMLNSYNISKNTFSAESDVVLNIHRMIEAFKFAYARRTELADPNFVDMTEVLRTLTSVKFADETRSKINDSTTFNDPEHYGAVYFEKDKQGTSHVSVISPEGDAVSVTSTINLYFGAGFASKQTGVVLNSVMDDFSVPGVVNFFGLPPSPKNFIEPGKKPMSSASPTIIVDRNGDVKLVIGASGGTRIPTAVVWVIIRYLWLGENLKEAVDASRIHHQLMPMTFSYEFGIIEPVVSGLRELGHSTDRYRERGSIICAVAKENGTVYGNADYRKFGDVFGFD